jgi:hypothetical protein
VRVLVLVAVRIGIRVAVRVLVRVAVTPARAPFADAFCGEKALNSNERNKTLNKIKEILYAFMGRLFFIFPRMEQNNGRRNNAKIRVLYTSVTKFCRGSFPHCGKHISLIYGEKGSCLKAPDPMLIMIEILQ